MKKIFYTFLISSFVFPIIGGWEVDPECPDCKYPFNVSLQTNEYYILSELQPDLPTLWAGHLCQGTLVDENWVLTTADCIDEVQNTSDIWTEIGLHNINHEISPLADSISVENIYIHPNYNSDQPWHYNYALLELSEVSIYEPIQLISDSTYEEFGDSVTVMGWGARADVQAWIYAYVLFGNNSTIGDCLTGWDGDETLLCLTPWDLDDYDEWEFQDYFEEGFPGGACDGDEGASLITINNDGNYELLGNYFTGCVLTYPHQNKFNRISVVTDWIYSYIGYPDIDDDGILDEDDNCIDDYNPSQLDTDNDQIGNACDLDDDNDGVLDVDDNCPEESNPYQSNFDGDEMGDVCDLDDDNDGVADANDSNDYNEFVCSDDDNDSCDDCSSGEYDLINDGGDYDLDGLCDAGDEDDDNDGVFDDEDCDPLNPTVSEFDCCGSCGGDNSTCSNCCGSPFNDDCTDDCYTDETGECCYNEQVNECGLCWSDTCEELGDLNLDGIINVVDIIMLVNIIINEEEYVALGDINEDGVINIVDVVALLNIILSNDVLFQDSNQSG